MASITTCFAAIQKALQPSLIGKIYADTTRFSYRFLTLRNKIGIGLVLFYIPLLAQNQVIKLNSNLDNKRHES